jgi:ribosomal-protein-alanine N-acetyltransferase
MTDAPDVPILETEHLRLRPLTEADAAGLHEAFGDPEAMRFWDMTASRDLAETQARIHRSIAVDRTWHASYAVELRETGRFVGAVNYHERKPWFRRLALGWMIVPSCWQRGYARQAVGALIGHCFDHLDTHRIEAEIDPANVASQRLAERLGFEREALLRDRMWVGDTPASCYMYALLRSRPATA